MGNLINKAGKGYGILSDTKNLFDRIGNAGNAGVNDMNNLIKDGQNINPRKYKKALDSANGINPLYKEREGKTRQDELERREVNGLEQEEQIRLKQAEDKRKEQIRKQQDKEAEELRRKMNPNGYISADEVRKKFRMNNNRYEDMLYKKNEDITDSEAKEVNKYTWFESKDKNLNEKLNNRMKQRSDAIYGTRSSQDATGRTISPEAKVSVKQDSVDLKTPDGYTMDSVYEKVSEKIASREEGAKYLQTKLNDYDLNPKLKVDGDIGPKTTSGLKYASATYGLNSVLKKLA